MIEKPNFFVLTGGPGVGKTTLVEHLRAEGEFCIDETARAVIREQVASGGDSLPWGDTQAYFEAVARRDVAIFDRMADEARTVFFDRGVVDCACWAVDHQITSPSDLIAALKARRCSATVFVAPPWREIYATDAERKQDWAEAEATYHRIRRCLAQLDYQAVELPKVSVAERAAFVRQVSTKARSST